MIATHIDTETETTTDLRFLLRHPQSTDGYQVNRLIDRCKPLDTNSTYCNLLQWRTTGVYLCLPQTC